MEVVDCKREGGLVTAEEDVGGGGELKHRRRARQQRSSVGGCRDSGSSRALVLRGGRGL